MGIEIEVISNETIKPSPPIPESLRKYQLSYLDQIAPPVFMPLVYFYPKDDKILNTERSMVLKKSLSQVLARFYPLSGRVESDLYVNCDNQGAPFVEAKGNCSLSQVMNSPVPKEFNKFLPYQLYDVQGIGMAVQVTFLECGGMAVGLLINHKIADALSLFMLINSWATAARQKAEDMPPPPIFEAASIFPPRDVLGFKASTGILKEELATKIFTFPASKISILRDRYADGGEDNLSRRRPTRIEALSAFIWSRFIATVEIKPDPNKVYMVLHALNLRTRLEPPLSEYYFGNIYSFSLAMPSMNDCFSDRAGHRLVQQVREAIRGVNGDYIAKLREGDNHLNFMKNLAAQANKGELVTFNFTSLCRFPLYEADFGWGKPAWVSSAGWMYQNLVTFLDTPSGDGIEAWINMKKEDMEKFEADLELKAFLSPKVDDAKTFGIQKFE